MTFGPILDTKTAAVLEKKKEEQGMVLKSGDKLKITVLNDEDITGEYRIDLMGNISLPMVGEVEAAYISVRDLRGVITQKLSDGYIVDPQVTIEVLNLRPFYILGAVNNPGTYPSDADLNVFKAIAIAGGLTPRADRDDYIIYRGKGPGRQEIEADDDTPVLPGDSIRVEERLF